MRSYSRFLVFYLGFCLLTACSQKPTDSTTNFPKDPDLARKEARGKLGGDDGGITLFGKGSVFGGKTGSSGIGVNSLLWRATLDQLSFMPLASADPFGGVIITDWYEDPQTPNERFKVNATILDTALRSDAIKVRVFKQKRAYTNEWRDDQPNPRMARQLEDAILTKAREMKVKLKAE